MSSQNVKLTPRALYGRGSPRHNSVLNPTRQDGNLTLDVTFDNCVSRWDLETGKQTNLFHLHENGVSCIHRNKDHTKALTCCFDGEVAEWEWPNWNLLRRWRVRPPSPYNQLYAYDVNTSPDGRWASCTFSVPDPTWTNKNYFVIVSSLEDPEKQFQPVADSPIKFVVWTKESKLAVIAHGGADSLQLCLFDPSADFAKIKHINLHNVTPEKDVHPLAMAIGSVGDKEWIALSRADRTVQVFDSFSLDAVGEFVVPGGHTLRMIQITNQGHLWLYINANNLACFNTEGKQIRQINHPGPSCMWFHTNDDENSVVIIDDNEIVSIDLASLQRKKSISSHQLACCGLAISPSGDFIASGDLLGNTMIWSSGSHSNLTGGSLPVFLIPSVPVRSLSWTTLNGVETLLIGGMSGELLQWSLPQHIPDASEGDEDEPQIGIAEEITSLENTVTCIRPCPTDPSLILVATVGGLVWLIDILSENPVDGSRVTRKWSLLAHLPSQGPQDMSFGTLQHYAEVWSLCWSPDGQYFASSSEDQSICIWDLQSNRLQRLLGHTLAVTGIDWMITSSGSHLLVSCSDDQTIRLWDPLQGKQLRQVTTTQRVANWHTLTYLTIDPSSSLAICSTQNGYLCIWDFAAALAQEDRDNDESSLVFAKKIMTGSVEGLAFDRNHRTIGCCSSDNLVHCFSIESTNSHSS